MVGFVADHDWIAIISTMYNAMAYLHNSTLVDVGLIVQNVEKVSEARSMVCDGIDNLVLDSMRGRRRGNGLERKGNRRGSNVRDG